MVKNVQQKEGKYKLYFMGITIFSLGCLSTLVFSNVTNTNGKDLTDISTIRKISTSKFIAPLLLSSDSKVFYEDDHFSQTISNYIKIKIKNGSATDISFYFKDLLTGRWTGVNENERYAPASLMKVPILIAVLKQAESDTSLLHKKLYYSGEKDLNEEEYYKPQKSIVKGHSYTVEELLDYMITYSDNNATVLLLGVTPQKNLSEIFTDLGLPSPEVITSGTVDYLSAKLYSRLFRVLYNSTYLQEEYSIQALKILNNIDFPNGIVSQMPKDIDVANKFGERTVYNIDKTVNYRELHDCGIVYVPKHPYLICIMTKGNDFKKLEAIIQDISEMTYKNIKQ